MTGWLPRQRWRRDQRRPRKGGSPAPQPHGASIVRPPRLYNLQSIARILGLGEQDAINQMVRHQFNFTFDAAVALESVTLLSNDHREAVQAFIEKRPGRYKGR